MKIYHVDTGELLGEHHHHSDEQRPSERILEHVFESNLRLGFSSGSLVVDRIKLGSNVFLASQFLQVLFCLLMPSFVDQTVFWRFWAEG